MTIDSIGCQQTLHDIRSERTNDSFRYLPPNGTLRSGWVVPVPNTSLGNAGYTQVMYDYTDSNGRRWRRLDKMEPQHVRVPEFNPERLHRFETAMRARPNEGDRILPANVQIAVDSAFPVDE
ncbi:hypothetical protein [Williamsia sp. 1135]|uniref:hypothetical protein n=1 Tax=Williamsia sp. 1135 TaxID=1889262 RepID=UPI000A12027A|nr:hypothetical protein [Williamsia sp. 1135]ORM38214.1 hypothetical protein BFL43_00705 [Williamsia sp. 1135]